MSKEVNIKVKVADAEEAKRILESVGIAVKDVGDKTAQTGTKTGGALDAMNRAWSSMHSLLLGGIAGALAGAALKVAQFFDQIKTKSDEAVRNLQAVRSEMAGIFEEMNAFSEGSRMAVTKQVLGLLKETRVSKEVGLPVIEEYTRQFKGKMPEEQYQQGLKEMLGYAARHGAPATKEMLTLMSGMGIQTPEEMGKFRRMVTAGAEEAGMQEEEVVGALGRAAPTMRAFGWTPQQAISAISVLGKGEIGRQKAALASSTIEALVSPQSDKLKQYGLAEQLAESPDQLFMAVSMKAAGMDRKSSLKMLSDIYGSGAAAGMYKLMTSRMGPVSGAIAGAAGPGGAAAEAEDEAQRMKTEEAAEAVSQATKAEIYTELTPEEQFGEKIRDIGGDYQKTLQRRKPVRQWISEALTIGGEKEKEWAAFEKWSSDLSEEERKGLVREKPKVGMTEEDVLRYRWREMSNQERFESLTGDKKPSGVNINYSNSINFFPRVGPDTTGPRVSNDIK